MFVDVTVSSGSGPHPTPADIDKYNLLHRKYSRESLIYPFPCISAKGTMRALADTSP